MRTRADFIPKMVHEKARQAIYHGDSRDLKLEDVKWIGCLVLDPPWDQWRTVDELRLPPVKSRLCFTDSRNCANVIQRFGPPTWIFVWDTMGSWNAGPHRPLQAVKFCFWYGDLALYQRDNALWGDAPPAKDHPTTKQTPADGRRLSELWRESLRWLHNPKMDGSKGTERFNARCEDEARKHAKPEGWLRCLIANTSEGVVVDPFLGSGTTLAACRSLNRRGIGCEIEKDLVDFAITRLSQNLLPFDGDPER